MIASPAVEDDRRQWLEEGQIPQRAARIVYIHEQGGQFGQIMLAAARPAPQGALSRGDADKGSPTPRIGSEQSLRRRLKPFFIMQRKVAGGGRICALGRNGGRRE